MLTGSKKIALEAKYGVLVREYYKEKCLRLIVINLSEIILENLLAPTEDMAIDLVNA